MNLEVTIIILFCHVEKYLNECVNYFLTQDFLNYGRNLAVDDSIDNSVKIYAESSQEKVKKCYLNCSFF